MHSDLFRLCRMLRERGVRTTILSSGLLLERHAAAIVRARGRSHRLAGRSRPQCTTRFAACRALSKCSRRSARDPPARAGFPGRARCTVQAANAGHLCATVEAARALGLRSISFLAADLSSTAFNRAEQWPARTAGATWRRTLRFWSARWKRWSRVPRRRLRPWSRPRSCAASLPTFARTADWNLTVAPRCNAPWVSAVIETNGDVRPCFFHPPIGNTAEGSLAAVLNCPQAISVPRVLRRAQDPICRRCVCSLFR